jgi:peroxiredoxin
MAAITPVCDFNLDAKEFKLLGVDGQFYNYQNIAGSKGTLIMFICNHCPYVIAVMDRIIRDATELRTYGIGVAAICSNDPTKYPDDSYKNMKAFAHKNSLPFPYLHDEEQSVAKAYEQFAHQTFLVTILVQNCNIVGGSTPQEKRMNR